MTVEQQVLEKLRELLLKSKRGSCLCKSTTIKNLGTEPAEACSVFGSDLGVKVSEDTAEARREM